jgi:hypothetical protein
MLRQQDIRFERGRGSHGDFFRVTHVPTGISRYHPGPLTGVNQRLLISSWISEIEAELRAEGLTQYIVEDHRTNGPA